MRRPQIAERAAELALTLFFFVNQPDITSIRLGAKMDYNQLSMPNGTNLVVTLRKDVESWIAQNHQLLTNERDLQVKLAKWLEDSRDYDNVFTEYGVPFAVLLARKPEIADCPLFPWNNDISVDIVVEKDGLFAALELKYTTCAIEDPEGTIFGEKVGSEAIKLLKNQAATNIRMYDFWKDVRRIEMLRETFGNVVGGLAMMITNNHLFWNPAKESAKYRNFSMEKDEYVGQGPMTWNGNVAKSIAKSRPDFRLNGLYQCHWDNTQIDPFRFMIAEINSNSVDPYRERLQKQLDVSDWFNGNMDRRLEKEQELLEIFPGKTMSVLIVDPDNHLGVDTIKFGLPELKYLHFDMSRCTPGDFNLIGQKMNQYISNGKYALDGLILDNIDQINAGIDTEDLQCFVCQALKRDNSDISGYGILPQGEIIPFDKMMVCARCKEIPEYLKDKSLQAYIIEA